MHKMTLTVATFGISAHHKKSLDFAEFNQFQFQEHSTDEKLSNIIFIEGVKAPLIEKKEFD